ncbi:hypothetical protein [Alishewanella sp. HL-SH06]|uniref:hypothetical protein n=1 Tax=Alishewanella sp. HL-SH06 TaxID=3461144 RepID=UPI004041DCF9
MDEWLNPKQDLAEVNRLCEVVMKNGKRYQAYRSLARGWFRADGSPLSGKSAMEKYRYIEDAPVKPWARFGKAGE